MIFVLLPAYNEEANLPGAIREIDACTRDIQHKFVVVDDGSTDRTAAMVQELARGIKIDIIRHGVNKGLAAAMRTGIGHVAGLIGDGDVMVAMDADGTHPAAILPSMLEKIRAGADVVIASRYAPGGGEIGLTVRRKILSRGASLLMKTALPVAGARDYTCGYRAYGGRIIRRATAAWGERLIESPGFTCMAELLVKLARLGARVEESPMVLRYDLKRSTSKIKVARTIREYISLVWRSWTSGTPPAETPEK